MTATLMYIHGYGSTGAATKAQLLRRMFPQYEVVSPTLDYDHVSPYRLQEQIRQLVDKHNIGLIVGSSFGGYQTLSATKFFEGPVWAVNPVREVIPTIQRVILNHTMSGDAFELLEEYKKFDAEVFRQLSAREGQLHFALSTDDELLGDHKPLLTMFPHYAQVVWKDQSGHRFFRFEELKDYIARTIPAGL